jgi:hypothetical protein
MTLTQSNPIPPSKHEGEALLLTGAVLVLGVALVMLARMFSALSTPSKTMAVMVAANLGGAVVNVLQSYYQLALLAQGRYMHEGDAFCGYSQPIFRGFEVRAGLGLLTSQSESQIRSKTPFHICTHMRYRP